MGLEGSSIRFLGAGFMTRLMVVRPRVNDEKQVTNETR